MRKYLLIFSFLSFAYNVSGQTEKAKMVLDLNDVQCSYFINTVPNVLDEYNKTPDSKIYLIYYEGKHISYIWNKKLKKSKPRFLNPRHGDALNRAKEVSLFLQEKVFNFPQSNLITINGGFRKLFTLEFWIVHNDIDPPKLTPTVDEKDIKFRRGKPFKIRECARIYDDL